MTVKWTEQLVLAVIAEARLSGFMAAERKLTELKEVGPVIAVMDGPEVVGRLLDACGFANLKIKAKGKFYLTAKKLSGSQLNRRFLCGRAYHGGGRLSIFDSTMRQEMSVNIAACEGQAKVLAGYGIESTIESKID